MDPSKAEPKPPAPDPEQTKANAAMQLEHMKMQAVAQGKQADIQATAQLEQMKIQFQAQAAEAGRNHEAQIEQMKMQMQMAVNEGAQQAQERQRTIEQQNEAQLNQMKFQSELEHKLRDDEFNRWKAQLESETKVLVAQIGAESKEALPENELAEPSINESLAAAMQGFTQALGLMNQPKTIIRGLDGRVVGIQ